MIIFCILDRLNLSDIGDIDKLSNNKVIYKVEKVGYIS